MSHTIFLLFFFFNDTATTEIYTLSLHDALPISVRGNVHDPDGTAVPDTNVDLTNSSGGQRLSTTTDEDGVFEFAKVPPGNYVLHVIVPGFDPVEKPVVVGSEPLARLRVKLKIAQVSEKVTVSGQAVVVAEDNRSQARFEIGRASCRERV